MEPSKDVSSPVNCSTLGTHLQESNTLFIGANQMKNHKSISRTKKTTAKLSDFLVREGAAAFVPGGGLLYDSCKALFNHGKSYFHDRTEIRLDEFHQAILTGGLKENEFKEFLDLEFDLDDYYAVLTSCAQDIEDEKTKIYSQLMQSLIKNTIEPEIRRHFITSSKSLTFNDLCFLKILHINSKFDLMTVGGTTHQVKQLLSSHDAFEELKIEKLISRGFIHKDKSGLTPIGEQYVESIYATNELKPESIGRKPWTGINIVIVSYQLDDKLHLMVSQAIQEALMKIYIKSSIQILNPRPTSSFFYNAFYGAGVLLVGEKKIEEKFKEALVHFSAKKPLVRLNLNTKLSDIELKEVKFAEEFTLLSETLVEIKSEINSFLIKFFPQDNE